MLFVVIVDNPAAFYARTLLVYSNTARNAHMSMQTGKKKKGQDTSLVMDVEKFCFASGREKYVIMLTLHLARAPRR